MSVEMKRDVRDEWPIDVPRGTFDIELGAPAGYDATAHIIFVCPSGKRCSLLIGPEHVGRSALDRIPVWHWDGDVERPTLKPSINCVGGCGAHFWITDGIMS